MKHEDEEDYYVCCFLVQSKQIVVCAASPDAEVLARAKKAALKFYDGHVIALRTEAALIKKVQSGWKLVGQETPRI